PDKTMRSRKDSNNWTQEQLWCRAREGEDDLGAPAESHGAGDGMEHRLTGALRFEVGGFQLEVPARLAIGIIHQHHAVFVPEAERLLFDHFTVLPDKARPEDVNDQGNDRKPRKNIPRGDEIKTAEIAANGRNGGAA